jgi:hypothetical protein
MTIDRLGQDAAILEAALLNRLRPDDPSLRDLLARRPEWGEILVQASAADIAPKVLSELGADERPEDRRWVDELLAEVRSVPQAEQRPHVARRPAWVLAAAAALLAAVGIALWRASSGRATEERQSLGANGAGGSQARPQVTCRTPEPGASAYETLDWDATAELRAGELFEVVVRTCAAAGETGAELAREKIQASTLLAPSYETRWSPPAEKRAQWPDCIEWSVRLLDESGQVVDSDSAQVERSPR